MFQKIYKSCNASPFKKSQFINRQRESEILLSRGWQLLLWLLSPLLWLLQQLHGCIVRPLAATIYRRTRHISDNTPPPDPIAGSWPSEVMYFYLPSQTTPPPPPPNPPTRSERSGGNRSNLTSYARSCLQLRCQLQLSTILLHLLYAYFHENLLYVYFSVSDPHNFSFGSRIPKMSIWIRIRIQTPNK